MLPFVNQILVLFGFTKYQIIIAVICLVILLGNFLGGLLRSILLAHGGPLKPMKLTQTMGFRLALTSELILVIFAFYYHAVLINTIDTSHIIYWVFAFMSSPVLAFMGSQITYLIFEKRIQENYRKYKKIQFALRERKKKAAEAQAQAAKMKKSAKRFNPHVS